MLPHTMFLAGVYPSLGELHLGSEFRHADADSDSVTLFLVFFASVLVLQRSEKKFRLCILGFSAYAFLALSPQQSGDI